MGFLHRLRTADEQDVGTFATDHANWRPGMELRISGDRLYRIVSIDQHDSRWWVVEPVGESRAEQVIGAPRG